LSTDVEAVRAASIIIALMMVAARTSSTSVDNYFTRQYIPEEKLILHGSITQKTNLNFILAAVRT
jgi:hypothetical protein